ncbi:hypothetical protein SUGI_0118130 [Cryptomeria japonica]|nr:hypothetical protein SUGI_0118130 [Cryptomeria japonica]
MVKAIYKSMSALIDIEHVAFLINVNFLGNMIFSKDMFKWDKLEKSQEFMEALFEMLVIGGKPNLVDYFPFLRPFNLQGNIR